MGDFKYKRFLFVENNFYVEEGDESNKFCIKESPMGNEAISHMFYTGRYHHDEGKHDDKGGA